jgi:hypothetical protein
MELCHSRPRYWRWKWQFRIGDLVRSGKTEARLSLPAMGRACKLRIDYEFKPAVHAG